MEIDAFVSKVLWLVVLYVCVGAALLLLRSKFKGDPDA